MCHDLWQFIDRSLLIAQSVSAHCGDFINDAYINCTYLLSHCFHPRAVLQWAQFFIRSTRIMLVDCSDTPRGLCLPGAPRFSDIKFRWRVGIHECESQWIWVNHNVLPIPTTHDSNPDNSLFESRRLVIRIPTIHYLNPDNLLFESEYILNIIWIFWIFEYLNILNILKLNIWIFWILFEFEYIWISMICDSNHGESWFESRRFIIRISLIKTVWLKSWKARYFIAMLFYEL